MKDPYNLLLKEGVPGARNVVLPNNYAFELNMDTWWSAVNRARIYSDYTGLDALYSYVMKSSTLVRAAIDKRLRPLRLRSFAVLIDGKEDERLSKIFSTNPLVKELINQKGLANFTFARVVGVDKDEELYVYPLRNLDVLNRAVKAQTHDSVGAWRVKNHVNLFWLQTSYQSEDTLGLLEPICRDYINAMNAQNNWQTASQFLAYQQLMMYYENGDKDMEDAAESAASKVGIGEVIVAGQTTDEITGKVTKNLELQNVGGGNSGDTFRIFKENIDSLYENIALVVLGSSLLMKTAKNTNSERLVRAHLRGFNEIIETDALDVQNWLNKTETKTKLAYLLKEPKLATATFEANPADTIDIGEVDSFTLFFEKMNLAPTDAFIKKIGLNENDIVGYENAKDVDKRNKELLELRKKPDAKRSVKDVVVDSAKRLFGRA
jgi:hypothetical protein